MSQIATALAKQINAGCKMCHATYREQDPETTATGSKKDQCNSCLCSLTNLTWFAENLNISLCFSLKACLAVFCGVGGLR